MIPDQDFEFSILGIMHDRILQPRMPADAWSAGSVQWTGPNRLLIRCTRNVMEHFLQVAELEALDHQAKGFGLSEIGAIEDETGNIFHLFPLPGINGNPDRL